MGRQRFTPKQIISKLREADVLVGRGSTAVEACRQIGLSTTSTRNDQNASLAARLRCAPPPAKAGLGGDLQLTLQERKSVVQGKRAAVLVEPGGRRIIKKQTKQSITYTKLNTYR